ncbi:Fur-regulated basic protein FbpA [Bacillus sp. EB600]|uniref:Fur-regulated basic protein FbpA n=1 Tax=Bacillus sp. EB600 TaxID=2806345 RepID=UPI0021091430|nr:Fur-regulated basic protein FbpA [Bacillus sp. EB600]
MENHYRKTVEDRRKALIDKLIAFSVYKEDDRHHLFELTLSELQNQSKAIPMVTLDHYNGVGENIINKRVVVF